VHTEEHVCCKLETDRQTLGNFVFGAVTIEIVGLRKLRVCYRVTLVNSGFNRYPHKVCFLNSTGHSRLTWLQQ
jgi:hypothetical protein